jgi:hypothetical protein
MIVGRKMELLALQGMQLESVGVLGHHRGKDSRVMLHTVRVKDTSLTSVSS